MLDELRQKPKAVRNRYAFWGAFLVTSLIALVWVVSLSVKFGANEPEPKSEKQASGGAFSQFLREAKDNFNTAVDTFEEEAGVPEDNEDEVVETTTSATTSMSNSGNPRRAILVATSSAETE